MKTKNEMVQILKDKANKVFKMVKVCEPHESMDKEYREYLKEFCDLCSLMHAMNIDYTPDYTEPEIIEDDEDIHDCDYDLSAVEDCDEYHAQQMSGL